MFRWKSNALENWAEFKFPPGGIFSLVYILKSRLDVNIELKWDMMLKDGSNECHFPFEINLFLNAVLESVLKHGQRRKIVFSSFSPDVCTL